MLGCFLFTALIDPWNVLPLHVPMPRVPISTNARFSFPALARAPRFDAIVIGTSTARLLRPPALDRAFGGGEIRFANLAMNAATAWEQAELLKLFARHHRRTARALVLDLDASWCRATPGTARLTGRAFPAWMYGGTPWRGYLHILSLYAVEQAANQFAVAIGAKRASYGSDGYTDFLPPDRLYDPARVAAIFRTWGPVSDAPAPPGPVLLPPFDDLPALLALLPRDATKLLFLPPITIETTGQPGSAIAAEWAACKRDAAAAVRATPNALLLDFAIPDPITTDHANFWDPLHYRVAIADRMVRDMALALRGRPDPDALDRVLARGPVP